MNVLCTLCIVEFDRSEHQQNGAIHSRVRKSRILWPDHRIPDQLGFHHAHKFCSNYFAQFAALYLTFYISTWGTPIAHIPNFLHQHTDDPRSTKNRDDPVLSLHSELFPRRLSPQWTTGFTWIAMLNLARIIGVCRGKRRKTTYLRCREHTVRRKPKSSFDHINISS